MVPRKVKGATCSPNVGGGHRKKGVATNLMISLPQNAIIFRKAVENFIILMNDLNEGR